MAERSAIFVVRIFLGGGHRPNNRDAFIVERRLKTLIRDYFYVTTRSVRRGATQ